MPEPSCADSVVAKLRISHLSVEAVVAFLPYVHQCEWPPMRRVDEAVAMWSESTIR